MAPLYCVAPDHLILVQSASRSRPAASTAVKWALACVLVFTCAAALTYSVATELSLTDGPRGHLPSAQQQPGVAPPGPGGPLARPLGPKEFGQLFRFIWAISRLIRHFRHSNPSLFVSAYHEAGHTLVALYHPGPYRFRYVAVHRYGLVAGQTALLSVRTAFLNRTSLMATMAVAMGGRAAEELVFGGEMATVGASHDLQRATRLASTMVRSLGMGRLGPVDGSQLRSDASRALMDADVVALLNASYTTARTVLAQRQSELHAVAKELVRKRRLTLRHICSLLQSSPPAACPPPTPQ